MGPEHTYTVRISAMAAALLALDSGPTYGSAHGPVVAEPSGQSFTLTGVRAALLDLAETYADMSGPDWDREASEKACTLRVARKIYTSLGEDLPYHLTPRKRRSPRWPRRRKARKV
jgi:hypothetical protein